MTRSILIAVTVAILALATTRDAAAQGTCQCNSGCHDMPGQCLISGTGCAAGYAPLCDFRPSGTCPHIGAVSCNGGCTCTPIPGYDAGTVDVPVTPVDATGVDVQGNDVQGNDVQGNDVQGNDVPIMSMDAQPGTDAQPGMDVQPNMDVPLYPDTQFPDVSCPAGVVIDGVCYSTPCQYQMEIGFVCTMQGYSCRQENGGAWCIPVCAGTVCDTGQYCDPTFGCTSTPDGGFQCATLNCPTGQVCDPAVGCMNDRCTNVACPTGDYCLRGECVAIPDGSGLDGSTVRADGSADGGHVVHRGGCGCRTPGEGSSPNRGVPALLAALGLAIVSRRRSRR